MDATGTNVKSSKKKKADFFLANGSALADATQQP